MKKITLITFNLALVPLTYLFLDSLFVLFFAWSVISLTIIYRFKNKPIISMYTFFLVSFVGLNFFSVLASGFDSDADRYQRLYSWLTLSSLILFVVSYELNWHNRNRNSEIIPIVHLRKTIPFSFGLYAPIILAIGLTFFEVFTSGGFNEITRELTKHDFGLASRLAKYFILLSSISFFIWSLKCESTSLRGFLVLLILIGFVVLIFLSFRTRSYMIAPIAGYLLGRLLRGWDGEDSKVKIRHILGFVLVGILVVLIAVGARFYRGFLEVDKSVNELDPVVMLDRTLVGGDLGYGSVIIQVMRLVDDKNLILYGQSYYRLLLTPIPRSILKDKPENTQQIVGSLFSGKNEYYTLPPGVQGDAYLNFREYGVLIFLLYGWLFSVFDRQRGLHIKLFTISTFVPIFHFARGAFTNPIITIIIVGLIYYVFFRKKIVND